jgi:hypothetical protein
MLKRLTGFVILLAVPAYAQQAQVLQKPASTDTVQCSDENLPASKSAVVLSPSGFEARLSLQAKAAPAKNDDNQRCVTTWSLMVGRKGAPLRRVFQDERNDDFEYSFEIDGWSEDGKLLLTSMIAVAGNWDETTPVIYDIERNKSYEIALTPLFDNVTPKNCTLYFRPLGFSATHQVLLDVGALDSDDLAPGEKPCFTESQWALDYLQRRVKRVPTDLVAQKFGTVVGGK